MRTCFGIEQKTGQIPPVSTQLTLSEAIIHLVSVLRDQQPQLISLIRKEFRSLTKDVSLGEAQSSLEIIAQSCRIPVHIVHEFFAHLQHIGYIPGCVVETTHEAKEGIQTYVGLDATPEQIITALQMDIGYNEADVQTIITFLRSLGSLPVVKSLYNQNITKDEMPRGLFRTISLNDIDYSRFSSLSSYLSFLLLNCKEQQNIFTTQYASLLMENGGIPVDDIPAKQTTILSAEKGVSDVAVLTFQGNTYPLHIRLLPGYSPVGIDIALGISFPTETGVINQNHFIVIGVQFEQQGGSVVPVIHTIQQTPHNIGADEQGNLIPIKEPLDNDKLLTRSQRLAFMDAVTTLFVNEDSLRRSVEEYLYDFSGLHQALLPDDIALRFAGMRMHIDSLDTSVNTLMRELLNTQYDPGLVLAYTASCYFFEKGYTRVQIIAPEENRRLMNHNQGRAESLKKSMYNLYTKKGLLLGGKTTPSGRVEITPYELLRKELSQSPISLKHMEVGSLVRSLGNMFPTTSGDDTDRFDPNTHLDQRLFRLFARHR